MIETACRMRLSLIDIQGGKNEPVIIKETRVLALSWWGCSVGVVLLLKSLFWADFRVKVSTELPY